MAAHNIDISISKEQLSTLSPATYPGGVVMVNNTETIAKALEHLYQCDAVGFDTETRPAFKKGEHHTPALMQVATDERCFLFRLCDTGLTPELIRWLEDPSCIKVGLSLRDDFRQLKSLSAFEPQGFVELQTAVRDYCIRDMSLSKIYAVIFGQRISKKQRITNWEAPQLTLSQQHYAALDAWACLKIYRQLKAGLFNPALSPYIVSGQTDAQP